MYSGERGRDGAGVTLTRFFSREDVRELDPFLLLDFFDSQNPEEYIKGFPWHPHRGIETITYLIDGLLEHGDSLGNRGLIEPLSCQWMTAGSGIVHQEMPQPAPHLLGTQLWLNLPCAHKMTEPIYRDITAKDMAMVEGQGMRTRVITGNFRGKQGPVSGTFVDPLYLDISLKESGLFDMEIPGEDTAFLFLLEGAVRFPDGALLDACESRGALLTQGERVQVTAQDSTRFLLFAGKPLREPVAWGGPIVMNIDEELEKAYEELNEGAFIKGKR